MVLKEKVEVAAILICHDATVHQEEKQKPAVCVCVCYVCVSLSLSLSVYS